MALVPGVWNKNASAKTARAQLAALRDLIDDHAQHWSIDESTEDDGAFESLLVRQGDQQVLLWYEEKEGDDDEVHVAMDPSGDIVDPINPSATASDEWTGLLTRPVSDDWNYLFDESELGLGCHFVELPDAFFWMSNHEDEDRFWSGFHAGVIVNPLSADDPSRGMTGHGIAFGRARFGNSFDRNMFGSNTSRIRVAWETWHELSIANPSTSSTFLGAQPIRPHRAEVGVELGYFRYHGQAGVGSSPWQILPGKDSNQGWLRSSYRTVNTQNVIIWDRTVLP